MAKVKYQTGLRRFGAAIIDGLVLIPLAFPDYFVRAYVDNKFGLLFWVILVQALVIFYSVFMHYKYGQTLGKMVANVKVLNIEETRNLTIKEALLRDSFYIIVQTIGFFYYLFQLIRIDISTTELLDGLDNFGGIVALIWVIIELVSMLANEKRRAVHDLIAGSVVIKMPTR